MLKVPVHRAPRAPRSRRLRPGPAPCLRGTNEGEPETRSGASRGRSQPGRPRGRLCFTRTPGAALLGTTRSRRRRPACAQSTGSGRRGVHAPLPGPDRPLPPHPRPVPEAQEARLRVNRTGYRPARARRWKGRCPRPHGARSEQRAPGTGFRPLGLRGSAAGAALIGPRDPDTGHRAPSRTGLRRVSVRQVGVPTEPNRTSADAWTARPAAE